MLFMHILLPEQSNFKKTLGQFENLGFVIMPTRENIRLIARTPLLQNAAKMMNDKKHTYTRFV